MFRSRHDPLHALLQSVRRRMLFQYVLRDIGLYTAIGIVLGLGVLLLSRVIAIPNNALLALCMLLLGLLTGVISTIIRRPTVGQVAAECDRHDLDDRVQTALHFERNKAHNPQIVALQREDATQQLQKQLPVILEHVRRWPFSGWHTGLFTAALAIWLFLFWIPNPMDDVLAEQAANDMHEEEDAASDEEEDIDQHIDDAITEAKEDVQEADLTETERQELLDLLDALQEEMAESDAWQEQMAAFEDALAELANLQENMDQMHEAFIEFAQQLGDHDALQGMEDALVGFDEQALNEAMHALFQQMAEWTEAEQQALAELLAEAAAEWAEQLANLDAVQMAALAEHIQQSAQSIDSTSISASTEELDHMHAALRAALEQQRQAAQFAQQAGQTAQQIQQSQAQLAQTSPGTQSDVAAGSSADSASGTAGDGAGEADADNSGNSAADGNAPGASSGDGGGSGAGGSNGAGNSGSGGSRSGAGHGSGAGFGEGTRELVNVPADRFESDEGSSLTIGGAEGDGTSETMDSDAGTVLPGMARPYAEVFREYEQYARESMERQDIPYDYQQMIQQYFSGLEP